MTADQLRSVWKRRFAKYSRWLHIYISMASCAIVLFFAVTGLTLNHADWFSGAERTTQTTGQVNVAWTNTGPKDVSKLDIVEFLRQTHHISGAVVDVRSEDRDLSIAFKGPGYAADVLIDRTTGKYELTESRLGLVAIVNDLHKGRDTGGVWKILIDASAILLTLISLTGLLLLYFVYKHRAAGYLLMGLGTAVTYIVYLAWVP
jgi:hypothetical protein